MATTDSHPGITSASETLAGNESDPRPVDKGSSILQEIVESLRARTGTPDGALPPLMVLLTIVTGIVDAVAYLRLGHVFVANMTGNVVFLGFSAAGASGLSVVGSLLAIACFLPGGIVAGRFAARFGARRLHQLRAATGMQLLLFTGAILIAANTGDHIGSDSRYALIILLALAMGVQNATARRLAVPDLTTTVLTLTLTGIAADSQLAGGSGQTPPDASSQSPRCCSARPSALCSCSRSPRWRPSLLPLQSWPSSASPHIALVQSA